MCIDLGCSPCGGIGPDGGTIFGGLILGPGMRGIDESMVAFCCIETGPDLSIAGCKFDITSKL